MANDKRRITLITRGPRAPQRGWDTSGKAPQHIVFVHAFTVLCYAVANRSAALTHDVGRIIVDHSASASEFLELLAVVPPELTADILLIDPAQPYLSATGRGGDRILYRLEPEDVEFYLDINGLVPSDRTALHPGERLPDLRHRGAPMFDGRPQLVMDLG